MNIEVIESMKKISVRATHRANNLLQSYHIINFWCSMPSPRVVATPQPIRLSNRCAGLWDWHADRIPF